MHLISFMNTRNIWYFFCKYFLSLFPDALYHNVISFIMHLRFKSKFYWLNIKHPHTFSEKLQYLKSHPVSPDEILLADKYEVRDFVRERLGDDYLIPLLGVYDNVDTIDWNLLPKSFVLKLTKGSGYNLICPDKERLDRNQVLRNLKKWMNVNPYYMSRELQYKGKPKIVCEKLLEYNITDYKFFCFSGEPLYVEVYMDRFGSHKKLFYDMQWKKMPFTTANDVCSLDVEKPEKFDEMFNVAKVLSSGLAFVRVDLYMSNSHVYFGEMTFHPAGGYTPITPREWDFKLGDLIKL